VFFKNKALPLSGGVGGGLRSQHTLNCTSYVLKTPARNAFPIQSGLQAGRLNHPLSKGFKALKLILK
ncbi:MAG: hypothetical protein CO029_03235, partial [Candidatus Magasanikbacteria bacterium CG_4_9_14_0_2_um_filter_41_10]